MPDFKPQARRLARRYALQALYQWNMAGQDLITIEQQFLNEHDMRNVETEYFQELLHAIPKLLTEIDESYAAFLDRKVTELSPIELVTLRMGCYELLKRPDIPFRVCINEAIELTKKFGTVDGYKYVNAVLDQVATRYRPEG